MNETDPHAQDEIDRWDQKQPAPSGTVEDVVRRMAVLHQVDEGELRFTLYENGQFTVTNMDTGKETIQPWYTDQRGRPWKVKKRKGFKGLVRMSYNDGDYDEFKSSNMKEQAQ